MTRRSKMPLPDFERGMASCNPLPYPKIPQKNGVNRRRMHFSMHPPARNRPPRMPTWPRRGRLARAA